MKHLKPILLFAVPAAAFASQGPPGPGLEITPALVDSLVGEAVSHNPGLQAAQDRADAADAAVDAVPKWDDPTASFGLWAPGPGGFPSSGQGNLVYGIEQRLPLHGRQDLMRQVAAAEASRERSAAASTIASLRRDLLAALYSQALADREAAIGEQDLAWLDANLSAVDHRYRVGQATQVDWLKIQTERAIAADDLETRRLACEHGSFALNRLLNRDPHATWPEISLPSLQPPLYYTPQLVEAALAAEPELKVMRQEAASAQAAADLTRTQRLPDVSLGLQAWQYSGDGSIKQGMVTVSFTVPWLNKSRHEDDWRRDRLRERASELAATDYALSVREELHHHIIALATDRRQALLYRDQLIPLAGQTLASAQAAWERNVGSFQDVLDVRRMLLADELNFAAALADQGTMLAEISYLAGTHDAAELLSLAGSAPADEEGRMKMEDSP